MQYSSKPLCILAESLHFSKIFFDLKYTAAVYHGNTSVIVQTHTQNMFSNIQNNWKMSKIKIKMK